MKLNQKGEGRTGLFIGLIILGSVIFVGSKVIPVAINVFAFEDGVHEECKYDGAKKVNVIQQKIFDLGQKENVPVDMDDIDVQKIENTLRVNVTYTVPITFPGYVYNWNQVVTYDAPVF